MRVRVRADTGRPLDHRYPCQLPTFGVVGYDPVAELFTVEIPDEDWPEGDNHSHAIEVKNTRVGDVVFSANDRFHKAWHAHLKKRYGDTEKFAPQLG